MKQNNISVICVKVTNKVPKFHYFGPAYKTLKTFENYNKIVMYGFCFSCIITFLGIICIFSSVSCPEDHIDFENKTKSLEINSLGRQESRISDCDKISLCKDNEKCHNTLEEINNKILSKCPNGIISELEVFNIDLPDDETLKPNWLNPKIKIILSLKIGYNEQRPACVKIEKGAFNIDQYKMKEIVFSNLFSSCPDAFLTREMLSGLERVQHFYIQQYTEREIHFERNLFGGLTFTNIQIERSYLNAVDIVNLIGNGSDKLNSVELIDFRFNKHVEILLNYSFTAVPSVKSIYLDYCAIAAIELDAFYGLKNMESVSLTNNNLKYLKEDAFNLHKFEFNIMGNDFICNCSMSWLLNEKYDKAATDCSLDDRRKINMYCFLKSCYQKNSSLIVAACRNETIFPTSSTAISSTTSTTIDPTTTIISTTENSLKCQTKFEQQSTKMTVKSFDSNYIEVEFNTEKDPNLSLWIGTQTSLENSCQSISERTTHIDNLSDSTPYILCLLDPKKSTVSPLDCLAVKTLPPQEERGWLKNKDKLRTMSITGGSVLLLVLISIITIYFVLRKYPKLLKNENVVVIDPHKIIRNPASFFVPDMFNRKQLPYLPETNLDIRKGFTNSSYFSPIPSIYSEIAPEIPCRRRDDMTYEDNVGTSYDRTLNHVYMTPVIRTRQRISSFSGISSGKNTLNSYIAIAEPTSNQLMNWRLNTLRKENLRGLFQSDEPPPLPPPRRKN